MHLLKAKISYTYMVHNDGVELHGLSKKTMDAIMMTATLEDVRETGPDRPRNIVGDVLLTHARNRNTSR
jgi:hypothetical protein